MERINRNIDIHMCICIHTYTLTFFVFFLSFFFSFTFFPSSFLAFFLVIHFLLFLCWYQGGKIHERKFDTCKVLVYIRQKCYFERGKKGKKLTRTYKVSRILKTLDTSTNVIRAIFSLSIYLFLPTLYRLQIHSDRLLTLHVRSSANQWKIRFLENCLTRLTLRNIIEGKL